MPPVFARPTFKDGLQIAGWTLETNGKFTNDVWRVRHHDERDGVIKTARGKKSPWPERFSHEVATIDELQSIPGVLRLLDRDPSGAPTWMVTEMAQRLSEHLGPEPDLGPVVSAFADVADTLVEAEIAGVAHRDIKPDNLFFARGLAVVGDFGLATGHEYAGLTAHGDRVGPSNFCAPEALEAAEGTDWFAADIYACAKSLWVVIAGTKYPPQGPLQVRRRESDLSVHGGRASEHLARLLEICTEDQPRNRPAITEVRDELRAWLNIHPAGTTPRPSRSQFRTAYSELLSARAIADGGHSKVADDAVHNLLDRCRGARKGGSRLVDDADADVDPAPERRTAGDSDWMPEHYAVKTLGWDGVGGVRLVGVGVLDGNDDISYDLSWQLRTPGTGIWQVTWRAGGRARMGLPSDIAERVRLADGSMRHRPQQLTEPRAPVSAATEEALRRVVTNIRRRELTRNREMDQAHDRVDVRLQATQLAREKLAALWKEFVRHLNSVVEFEIDTQSDRRDETWFLVLGDRRLMVQIATPPTHVGVAILLGTVTLETEGADPYKSHVANVCAIRDTSGAPLWQLIRFQRNDMARPPAPVSESLGDGNGAVALDALARFVDANKVSSTEYGDTKPDMYPEASLVERVTLDVDSLLRVFTAELAAFDEPDR